MWSSIFHYNDKNGPFKTKNMFDGRSVLGLPAAYKNVKLDNDTDRFVQVYSNCFDSIVLKETIKELQSLKTSRYNLS